MKPMYSSQTVVSLDAKSVWTTTSHLKKMNKWIKMLMLTAYPACGSEPQMTSYRVLCVQSSCTWVCVFAVIWQWWFSAGLLRAAQIHPAQRVSCGVAVLCRPGEQQPAPVSVSASLHAYEKVWKWKRWESLQIFIFPMVLLVRRKSYLCAAALF